MCSRRAQTVEVWHSVGDGCGPPCFYLHRFLAELADAAQLLVLGAPHQKFFLFGATGLHRPMRAQLFYLKPNN